MAGLAKLLFSDGAFRQFVYEDVSIQDIKSALIALERCDVPLLSTVMCDIMYGNVRKLLNVVCRLSNHILVL